MIDLPPPSVDAIVRSVLCFTVPAMLLLERVRHPVSLPAWASIVLGFFAFSMCISGAGMLLPAMALRNVGALGALACIATLSAGWAFRK